MEILTMELIRYTAYAAWNPILIAIGVLVAIISLIFLMASIEIGDTALVLEGANLVKYKATSTSAISKDTTSAYSIPLTAATKKVAAFRIIDANDLNIVEA